MAFQRSFAFFTHAFVVMLMSGCAVVRPTKSPDQTLNEANSIIDGSCKYESDRNTYLWKLAPLPNGYWAIDEVISSSQDGKTEAKFRWVSQKDLLAERVDAYEVKNGYWAVQLTCKERDCLKLDEKKTVVPELKKDEVKSNVSSVVRQSTDVVEPDLNMSWVGGGSQSSSKFRVYCENKERAERLKQAFECALNHGKTFNIFNIPCHQG